MNKMKRTIFLLILLSGPMLLTTSCLSDVSHENPLDPKSGSTGYIISGIVNTRYAPYRPVANAVVSLFPGNSKVFSDNDGNFIFSGVAPGAYTVYCSADGRSRDSLNIQVATDRKIDFFLDGLPFFEGISLTTHHISRFFPVDDLYFLQIDAQVNDLDGIANIKQVSYAIPAYSASDTLAISLNAGFFSSRLNIENLPISSIHSLIGRSFILSVTDDPGQTIQSDPRYLTRVIDPTPVVISPTNLQVVANDSITFAWQKTRLPYFFTQSIEISQINLGLLTRVAEFKAIPSGQTKMTIENTQPTSDYIWILSVKDEFGNTSSSKEGSFHISK